MKRRSISLILASVLLASCCAGCSLPTGPEPFAQGDKLPSSDSGFVSLWISADKDTYASRGRAGEEGDRNFGQSGSLVVAFGPLGIKQSYVHFTPPSLPPGTEILESKFELYHSGKNEDGSSDEVLLNVAAIRTEGWNPSTLTWNNRPDRDGLPAPDAEIRLRSQNWSGTPDIRGIAEQMIASPSSNHGFLVWYRDPSGRQLEKGFYSNNDNRRRQNDLGLAPRLLMRVKLPPGTSAADMVLGFLPPDSDLTPPRPITMVRTRQSEQWPADWNVSP